MVIETSALISNMGDEPGRDAFNESIEAATVTYSKKFRNAGADAGAHSDSHSYCAVYDRTIRKFLL